MNTQRCLHIILTLSLFLPHSVFAQLLDYNKTTEFLNANKVWVFPDSSGLDFNGANVTSIPSNMSSTLRGIPGGEGAASICDSKTGKLLFYSNGRDCWNADGVVMPNGDSLFGNEAVSTVQGAVIVPVLGDVERYYLFSLAQGGENIGGYWYDSKNPDLWIKGSLFYSVVDMTLDGGKGDIVPGLKNIPLDTVPLSEGMIAIPGNNCDIWLLAHEAERSIYRAFNISSSGINPTPVISLTSGAVMPAMPGAGYPYENNLYLQGALAVSPNRELIAMNMFGLGLFGGLTLSKFDANTGHVFDELQIGASLYTSGSTVEFSPDNSKLYTNDAISAAIVQYDISNFDTASINASKYLVGGLLGAVYLRLYNNTIYGKVTGQNSISMINNPNGLGASCGYQRNAISPLIEGVSEGTLPVESVCPFLADTVSLLVADTLICSGYQDGILLMPEIISQDYDYFWSNSGTDTLVEVFEGGTYWVMYGDGCHTFVDSFILRGADLETPVITVELQTLSTSLIYDSYQWLLDGNAIEGATERHYEVTKNGKYQVIVTNKEGCRDTSAIYQVTNANAIGHSRLADRISIYPNPVGDLLRIDSEQPVSVAVKSIDGRTVLEVDNTQALNTKGLHAGMYLVHLYDSKGVLLKVEKIIKE